MRSIPYVLYFLFLSLGLSACGGPSICDCDQEAAKDNPDAELLEECRSILGSMEMEEVLEALKKCEETER
ncbi:MAG: hypothetical protein AAGN35_09385 [Bacteroidota bacterium]